MATNLDIKNIIISEEETDIDFIKKRKMLFIFNALNNGWIIKKRNKQYIFYKKHNNNKQVFSDDYLTNFMKDNWSK